MNEWKPAGKTQLVKIRETSHMAYGVVIPPPRGLETLACPKVKGLERTQNVFCRRKYFEKIKFIF